MGNFSLLRYLFLLLFPAVFLLATESAENNATLVDENKLVKVEDTSGLTEDEVRQVAKKIDQQEKKTTRWEELSPTPIKSDWVETKSGEWFRGKIKGCYNEKLEFDSDEIGVYTFDFDDIKAIKSYQILSVNIENLASISGIVRLNGDKLTIIQGDEKYVFPKSQIVSFAPDAKLERNLWSGEITFNFDIRSGNINQADYAAQFNLKRRTATSILVFDYLGRISSKDGEEIANDHRVNEKYDRYITRHFFWTPIFSEYYTDKYKNIKHQATAGSGLGYTLIDTKKTLWNLSGGPAIIYTQFYTVETGNNNSNYSPALELSTKFEQEISSITDFTYNYKMTFSDRDAGVYKHHMVVKFENDLTSWLDIDFTGIWDYVAKPTEDAQGIKPKSNDYQFLVGLGIEF
jgi:putative salt-induced outer membrane protein YdiY